METPDYAFASMEITKHPGSAPRRNTVRLTIKNSAEQSKQAAGMERSDQISKLSVQRVGRHAAMKGWDETSGRNGITKREGETLAQKIMFLYIHTICYTNIASNFTLAYDGFIFFN